MSENKVPFQVLPTTGRGADTLARRHGYRSLADLAHSLPPNAQVLDVGAGASPLGKEVTRLRPDVHWANLDFGYYDERILREAKGGALPNLRFIAGDATNLGKLVKPDSVDAVFSYWLLPHLSTYNRQTAITVAEQIYTAVKPGGIVAIGPRRQPRFDPACILGKSWRTTKVRELTAEAYSREVLRRTQLSAPNRYIRRAFNAAAFEVFHTGRYLRGGSISAQQVYNPTAGAYISLYSPAAVVLVTRLVLRTGIRLIFHWRFDIKAHSE